MPPSRSLRRRLMLALGTITLLVFSVLGGALYLKLSSELERAYRSDLRAKSEVLLRFIERATRPEDIALMHGQIGAVDSGVRVWLLSDSGDVLLGMGPLPEETGRGRDYLHLREPDGTPLEGLRTPVVSPGDPKIRSVLVGIDIRPRRDLLRTYLWIILIACGSGVLLSAALTDWAMRHGLEPLRRLSREATRLSPSSLSRRLRTDEVDQEVEDLVRSLNGALDRVEAAYRQMESFNADVAHELRTPVASLISAAQVTLTGERSPEALRDTLEDQLEHLERMKGMINDMLFLARADLGEAAQDARPVDLIDQVHTTVEFYEAVLADAGVSVIVDGSVQCRCNPGLIRRALSNLLSNAIRHTAQGGTIRIQARSEGDAAVIEVFNPGEPLSERVRTRMFDRFFRADEARCPGGHGLGLAIVRAVARMHGGEVAAPADPTGTRVVLKVPLQPSFSADAGSR